MQPRIKEKHNNNKKNYPFECQFSRMRILMRSRLVVCSDWAGALMYDRLHVWTEGFTQQTQRAVACSKEDNEYCITQWGWLAPPSSPLHRNTLNQNMLCEPTLINALHLKDGSAIGSFMKYLIYRVKWLRGQSIHVYSSNVFQWIAPSASSFFNLHGDKEVVTKAHPHFLPANYAWHFISSESLTISSMPRLSLCCCSCLSSWTVRQRKRKRAVLPSGVRIYTASSAVLFFFFFLVETASLDVCTHAISIIARPEDDPWLMFVHIVRASTWKIDVDKAERRGGWFISRVYTRHKSYMRELIPWKRCRARF